MKPSSHFIIVLFLLLITSCYNNYRLTASGFSIPKGEWKKYKTLRQPFQLTDTAILSPSAVYQNTKYGGIFKFYEDGRFLAGGLYDSLGKLPYSKIKVGHVGFYRLDGNKLTIELWYATKGWGPLILKGEINNDSIHITSDKWGGTGRNINHYRVPRDGVEYDSTTQRFKRVVIDFRSVKRYMPNISFPQPDW